MKQRITQLLADLKWYESAELAAMALYIISVSIYWRAGIFALALVLICSVIKMVAERSVGNTALTKVPCIGLLLMILYYFVYLFSIHYSNSPLGGFAALGKKTPMLAIPLIFLLSDFSYIRQKHVSSLSLLLALTLTGRFLIMAVQAILDSIAGTSTSEVIHANFDPMHYNYLALYIITAVIVLFFETVRVWQHARWRQWRWVLLAALVCMAEYIILLGSRSGLLTLIFVAIAIVTYLFLLRKRTFAGIAVLSVLLIFGINRIALPEVFSRAEKTVEKIENEEDGDTRQELWRCAWGLVDDHEIVGYGNDGYGADLSRRYEAHDLSYQKDKMLNTHNQYLEALLVAGIIGLIILLAMMAIPTTLSITRAHWNPVMALFVATYALWIFFEEAFSRQMGILFICWWHCFFLSFGRFYSKLPYFLNKQ